MTKPPKPLLERLFERALGMSVHSKNRKNYRAAVIGLGRMGSTFDDEITQGGSIFLPYCHAPTYAAAPNVSLVAGADLNDEQRVIFGDRWGVDADHLYTDYQEMLEKEDLDLVSVCTTARHRSEIVQNIASSGVRAIWAEKPIALSLEEADDMLAACDRTGVALAVNCARRYNPFFAEARRMIAAGEVGKLRQITAYTHCTLSHNGSHAIDTIRYLAGGEVEWVFGEMESDKEAAGENDLRGNGYLAFDNGVRAYLWATPTGCVDWEFDIIGEEVRIRSLAGALEFELIRNVAGGSRNRGLPARSPFPVPARMQGMGFTILEDLIEAAETGRSPRCSGQDGRAALEVAIALRQSHRLGGTRVNLPILDRSQKILSIEITHDHTPALLRR